MRLLRAAICAMILTVLCTAPGAALDLTGQPWQVILETGRLGPLETTLVFEKRGGGLHAASRSGALALIRALPEARKEGVRLEDALFAFTLQKDGAGYSGTLSAPWPGRKVSLTPTKTGFSGRIEDGMFAGQFTGQPTTGSGDALRDYPAILTALQDVVARNVFEPDDLKTQAYRRFASHMAKIAAAARDDLDLVLGFHLAWTDDPFSHFGLRRAAAPAEEMMRGFDKMRLGRTSAHVAFDGDVAVLTVETMMGLDTIEQIEQAYDEITRRGAKALVIDLRGNGGGAFAVKPLVEHVLAAPLDAGYFMAHKWNAAHDRLPNTEELAALTPWAGWSIIAFWTDVQTKGLMKIRFEPATPHFAGPVFVVLDRASASATELAADALRASGRAVLVGERSVGQMLSQSFFDVADGFVVSLPVADYYSMAHGRIEGSGVPVDVAAPSTEALAKAKSLARAALAQGK